MTRYVRAYLRARRAPADVYYAWALWDARAALEELH